MHLYMQYLPVKLTVIFLLVVLKLLLAKQEYPTTASEESPKPFTVVSTDTLFD